MPHPVGLWSKSDFAAYTGYSTRTLDRLAAAGLLPAPVLAVGGRKRWDPETIRRWIRDGRLTAIDLGADSAGWRIDPADLDAFIAARRGTRVKQEKGSPR